MKTSKSKDIGKILNRKFLLILAPVPVFFLACVTGAYHLSFLDILTLIVSGITGRPSGLPEEAHIIFFLVRLPRIFLALLVGAAFSVSGAGLQAIFRNPLVDSYILGLASGAAFGAALSIVFLPVPVQFSAFLFGLLAVGIAYFAAKGEWETSKISLVLAGVMTSAFFTALLSVINIIADPLRLQGIVYWMMGSLHTASWDKVLSSFPMIMLGTAIIYYRRWKLNVLSMGDQEASGVGLNPERERILLITAAALTASSAVAVAGIIGLVGLMVPHIIRMLLGPDHKKLIPLCITFGSAFLLLVDTLARSIADFEIPVGIITTLTGVPFFIYLLRKTRIGGWL